MGRHFRTFALAVVAIVLTHCKAKEDEFFAKTFSCDSLSPNSCGTDRAGVPLVCFAARQYGGTDFCAPSCDQTRQDARFTCQDDTAWIQVCDLTSPSSPCPAGFTCRAASPRHGLCVLPCSPGVSCAPLPGPADAGHDAPPDASMTDAPIEADAPGDSGDIVHCAGSNDACRGAGDGRPMVCVNSSSLGGRDFCAEACDPAAPVEDPLYRCSDMGALLQKCHPSSHAEASSDCPPGLNCFRTNLMADEGVCLDMPVCSLTEPCAAPRVCLANKIGGSSAQPADTLDLDHLNCVLDRCTTTSASCGDSEGCLGTQYASTLSDMCVPRCPDGRCPPNFSCATTVSGMPSEDLCLPGVPGARCDGSNCLLGSCEATGTGFNVCSKPCSSDATCAPFTAVTGDPFVCAAWGGPSPHCVTPRPFSGSNCDVRGQCLGQSCFQVDPFGPTADRGQCRVECKADGTCDPQGGLPFTCLFERMGGCYPGILGLPCKDASECISGLSCEDVLPELDLDAGAMRGSRICTASCEVDGGTDRDGDPLCNDGQTVVQGGYCARGTCRLPRVRGMPCDRDRQCLAPAACNPVLKQCL